MLDRDLNAHVQPEIVPDWGELLDQSPLTPEISLSVLSRFSRHLNLIRNPKSLAVVGLPASGKATLCGQLQKQYPDYFFNLEPNHQEMDSCEFQAVDWYSKFLRHQQLLDMEVAQHPGQISVHKMGNTFGFLTRMVLDISQELSWQNSTQLDSSLSSIGASHLLANMVPGITYQIGDKLLTLDPSTDQLITGKVTQDSPAFLDNSLKQELEHNPGPVFIPRTHLMSVFLAKAVNFIENLGKTSLIYHPGQIFYLRYPVNLNRSRLDQSPQASREKYLHQLIETRAVWEYLSQYFPSLVTSINVVYQGVTRSPSDLAEEISSSSSVNFPT